MNHRMIAIVFAAACGGGTHPGGTDSNSPDGNSELDARPDGSGSYALPPLDGRLDYQLGGPYAPPAGVTIVSRDRNAPIAPGLYNICYVNGFQIQPDEEAFFLGQHPELVLRDGNGNPVIDADWNEMLIDIRSPAKRTALAAIVDGWIAGCAQAGYSAIEIDNLDSYVRSRGLLAESDAVATMQLFATAAHARDLAIAQKNSSELVSRKAELGTDFVVAEECNRYSECDVYRGGYGDHVLVIEYRLQDFTAGCAAFPQLSIVLRDVNLVTPGQGAYVYNDC